MLSRLHLLGILLVLLIVEYNNFWKLCSSNEYYKYVVLYRVLLFCRYLWRFTEIHGRKILPNRSNWITI